MQFYPFKPTRSPEMHITYSQIVKAMREAGKDSAAHDTGKKYAVMNPRTGETFSPKDTLRRIIGDKSFYGGKGFGGANQVFHAFGFPVGRKEKLLKSRLERLNRSGNCNLRVDTLVGKLFEQKWRPLPSKRGLRDIKLGQCPGVYALAYSERVLTGKRLQESDVFYVG